MITTAWQSAINSYDDYLAAMGKPKTTRRLWQYWITRAADDIGPNPWQVNRDDVLAWFCRARWGLETRRSVRSALRGFYRWGVDSGQCTANPTNVLGAMKQGPIVPKPTPDQIFRAAMQAAGPRERLMLRLAAEAGLRRGEVCSVNNEDLVDDILGYCLLVHGKGNKPRLVPINESLCREIKAACNAGGGWAFPSICGGHLQAQTVGKLVAGLLPPGYSMHSLRHRFATRAYCSTHDLLSVQALLGHASPSTTQRYVALDTTQLRLVAAAAA